MKVVVGIDLAGKCSHAMGLVRSLWGRGAELELVNSVEPVLPDGSFPDPGGAGPLSGMINQMVEVGRERTVAVAEEARQWAANVNKHVELGAAAETIMRVAGATASELVAVGSERKGAFGSLFMGSVSRSLAIHSPVSVLVGKETKPTDGPLNIVVARDHSPYGERAIEKFFSWTPRISGSVHVLTAHQRPDSSASWIQPEAQAELEQAWQKANDMYGERNAQLAETLSGRGWNVTQEVTDSDPKDLVGHAMRETDASLLVIGAQGHGFLERLMLGSFALHQVVNEPWNVLVVRA